MLLRPKLRVGIAFFVLMTTKTCCSLENSLRWNLRFFCPLVCHMLIHGINFSQIFFLHSFPQIRNENKLENCLSLHLSVCESMWCVPCATFEWHQKKRSLLLCYRISSSSNNFPFSHNPPKPNMKMCIRSQMMEKIRHFSILLDLMHCNTM